MNKQIVDMDGNELNIGDIVLFGTGNKRIARAEIISMNKHGRLELHTLKNRKSIMWAEWVLLDTTTKYNKEELI